MIRWWVGAEDVHPRLRTSAGETPPPAEVAHAGWATVRRVRDEIGNPVDGADDARHLETAVAAANLAVARWRPDLWVPAILLEEEWDDWSLPPFADATTVLGTTTLALRWFRRVTGGEGVFGGEFGTYALPAIDHDLAEQLRVGRSWRPRVA